MTEETNELKRTYTIPLRRSYANTPKYKRANKAVRVLKKFLVKHMKSEKVKIGPKLNDLLWVNGIKNPPGKVTVIATKDSTGIVRTELVGSDYVDFKQQEKVDAPKGLQEKLKKTVEDAKGGTQSSKATSASTKVDEKVDAKTAQSNKDASAVKTETKKPVAPKAEVKKEAPVKTETKAE